MTTTGGQLSLFDPLDEKRPAPHTTPRRIHWQARRPGWHKPPGVIYVGRPTRWANPFRIFKDDRDYERAVAEFRAWLAGEIAIWVYRTDRYRTMAEQEEAWSAGEILEIDHTHPPTTAEIRKHLGGKDLGCWCSLDQPCHADVLLELANTETALDEYNHHRLQRNSCTEIHCGTTGLVTRRHSNHPKNGTSSKRLVEQTRSS